MCVVDSCPPHLTFLSPFVPNTCCTHAFFFPVCTNRQVVQFCLFKVNSNGQNSREFIYLPQNVSLSIVSKLTLPLHALQSTHGSRAVASDYENEPHPRLPHPPVDFDHQDMLPLFSDTSPEPVSRRDKVSSLGLPSRTPRSLTPFSPQFYGFLSHSSRSRSRSRGGTHPSDTPSTGSPDLQNATTITTTSTSGTSDSHCASLPTSDLSTSRIRSPPRPPSGNTTTTGDTVTPRNIHSRASRAGRPPRPAQLIPHHLINDSGIGVDEPLITYDPRMPPPPVPAPASAAQPTQTKEKRRSKQLFGLPAPPWSRPTTPKVEEHPALPPPLHSPPIRPSKVSKIESWFKFGASFLFLLKVGSHAELTPVICCR